ncbi:MAG: redox-regulated ATPase YchF [Acidobacteria bacterium]|nr:MAG: redox-regulated ATPase YchF [Acidobacteriota bacterium]
MQLGILGLPKAGKTTLFNILTAARQSTDKFAASKETHVAVAKVPDRRLERLRDLYRPRRYLPATIEYVDIPGIEKGGQSSLDLGRLRNVDALVHVVRAFDDPELVHPEGSVDPARDVELVDLELVLADHGVVERRLERLARKAKGKLSSEETRERQLLAERILPALEDERPLRTLELGADDEKRLRGFQLLSAKPMLLVLNVGEDDLGSATCEGFGLSEDACRRAVIVSAPIEDEIAQLAPAEQGELLAELGLEEPSLDRVLRASYELLGLISFFTVGDDEVRAWTIRRGTVARDAAGTIHSDLARGFIRAEVVGWQELLDAGSWSACRERGLLRLEGKGYEVKDGDVINVRFNV